MNGARVDETMQERLKMSSRRGKKNTIVKWQSKAGGSREQQSRHLLRRCSPPVSLNAILEVQHSEPPDVHVEHVIITDILWEGKNKNTCTLIFQRTSLTTPGKLETPGWRSFHRTHRAQTSVRPVPPSYVTHYTIIIISLASVFFFPAAHTAVRKMTRNAAWLAVLMRAPLIYVDFSCPLVAPLCRSASQRRTDLLSVITNTCKFHQYSVFGQLACPTRQYHKSQMTDFI